MTEVRFDPGEYRSMVDSAPDAMVIVDGDGRIVLVNRRACEVFGYADTELVGQPVEFLIPARFHDGHRRRRDAYRDQPHPRPMGSGLELFGRRKDGTEFPVEISLSPIASSRILIASAIRDVSDRKRIENELRLARESADSANRAKSQFLATASHDLRQPLQTLRLLNGALEDVIEVPELREILGHQAQAIGAMGNLLNSLLDISKLEAGVVKPAPADFDVQALMQGLRQEFESIARQKRILLTIEECSEYVHSDAILVGQVLRNLLANAIKFTESGSVSLRCIHAPDCLRMEVADTGVGIPADELTRIFEDFYQVQRGAARKAEGFGLGLSIVKRLAELLDLRVSVESPPRRGTRFTVDLPLATSRPRIQTPRPRPPGAVFDRPHAVLLVEDDAGLRFASRRWLAGRGLRVQATSGGAEAMAAIDQGFMPELVISDYHLGNGETGLEVLRQIRAVLGRPVPALMLSGDTSRIMREITQQEGIRLLNKPADPVEFLAEIRNLLG
ncbi:MAG: PAS domain S-box protein [Alphaproteobacteria bacterium]|nr:PAS domain S-box protein [Alphaproteobacteria bacterium]